MNDILIKQCRAEDLALLAKTIPPLRFHKNRFKHQEKGDSIYLIAWFGDITVGHLNLKFKGSDEEYVKSKLGLMPELNAIGVDPPEMRSRGIGRKLINEAEKVCREKGFKRVGLAVDTSNIRAEELYKKIGYLDSGIGEFDSIWYDTKEDGYREKYIDHCIYLVKDL